MNPIYLKLAISLVVSLFLLRLTVRIAPRIYSVRFLTGYYVFQFGALIAYLTVLPDSQIWNIKYSGLYYKDFIDEGILAYLLFILGGLAAVSVGYFMIPSLKSKPGLVESIKANPRGLEFCLMFTAVVFLVYPFLSYRPGVGFFSAMLFNYLNFIPFVAGIYFSKSAKVRWLWFIAMVVLFALSILGGSRGTAMTAIVMYAVGYYYGLETRKSRRWTLSLGVFVAIPLMTFMAFVGIFRSIVGRNNFDKIDFDKAVKIYQKYEKLKNSKVLRLDSEEAKLNSWGRIINAVNFTELAIVPAKMPHIGATGMLSTDFKYAFDIAYISGTTAEDRLRDDFANFKLNDYGYHVTLKSSVEYSILTEAYIRFGFPGIFWFSFIICLFSIFLETWLYQFSRNQLTLQIFLTVMMGQQALLAYSISLYPVMRTMIVGAAIDIVLLFLLLNIRRAFLPKRLDAALSPQSDL